MAMKWFKFKNLFSYPFCALVVHHGPFEPGRFKIGDSPGLWLPDLKFV